jgi:hypothetical protein
MSYKLSQFYVDRYGYGSMGNLPYSFIPTTGHQKRQFSLAEDWNKHTSKENISSIKKINVNNLMRHSRTYLDWTFLTMHVSLNIRDILEASDLPWNYLAIHGRSDFACELVKDYPQVGWNWTAMFHVWQDRMLELIRDHPDAPWNWEAMVRVCSWSQSSKLQDLIDVMPSRAFRHAYGQGISWDIISQNIDKAWDFTAMSRHVPWWFIARHPSLPWCANTISTRWDLPRALLFIAPHLIKWKRIWRRPWVTEAFVRRHWQFPWRGPTNNKRRDHAARVIQAAWRLNIWFNPHTGPGKRRLLREFNELCAMIA